MPDFFRTTVFRHALTIAAFFTASSLVVFAFVYWETVTYASREIDREVTQIAHEISNASPFYVDRRLNRWLRDQARTERYGLLTQADGRKVAGNMDQMPEGTIFDGQTRSLHTLGLDGNPEHADEIIRAVANRLPDGRLLLIGIDTDEWEHFRDMVMQALAIGLLPTALLGCLGGALFGRSTLKRMATMDASIDRIIHGDLSERLPQGKDGRLDEIDLLALRINSMLDDLQRLLMEVQVVGDTIAHDLRTPLTRVLTRLQTARERARTAEQLQVVIDEATQWLTQTLEIITAVLRIGEIEHGQRRAGFRAFDAAALLREVHDLMAPLAEEKGVFLGLDIDRDDTTITGDRELILEALVNLVDNAVKFTPPGGVCRLELAHSSAAAILRVTDEGPGIPEAEREAVLRRFYKAGAHRNAEGAGLGLALVAAVARLHAFDLVVADAEPGCVMELHAPSDGRQPPPRTSIGALVEA